MYCLLVYLSICEYIYLYIYNTNIHFYDIYKCKINK